MPRGIPETATSEQREAARKARNDRVQEVVYLLAWLTHNIGIRAHVSLVDFDPGASATMNHVVCVHHAGKRLVWRISDFELFEYFKHLEVVPCERGLNRADKMEYLANMLSDW